MQSRETENRENLDTVEALMLGPESNPEGVDKYLRQMMAFFKKEPVQDIDQGKVDKIQKSLEDVIESIMDPKDHEGSIVYEAPAPLVKRLKRVKSNIAGAIGKWSNGDNKDILKCIKRVEERDLLARAQVRADKQEIRMNLYSLAVLVPWRIAAAIPGPAAILLTPVVFGIFLTAFFLWYISSFLVYASNRRIEATGSDFYETKFGKFIVKVPLLNRMIEPKPQSLNDNPDNPDNPFNPLKAHTMHGGGSGPIYNPAFTKDAPAPDASDREEKKHDEGPNGPK